MELIKEEPLNEIFENKYFNHQQAS